MRSRAIPLLFVATFAWALSFSLYKALALAQQNIFLLNRAPELLPSTWFLTGSSLVVRFGLSALILFWLGRKKILEFNRFEISQGLGLGFFGGFATLFQMDALNFASASVSAFLTQCYCLIIPIFLALKNRARPSWRIFVSCILVLWGVGILSGMSLGNLRLGRGELETVIASCLFAGQILWVERPQYKNNRATPVTFFMFGLITLLMTILSALTTINTRDIPLAYSTPSLQVGILLMTFIPTLAAYLLMNRWQPFVSASEAALIYCAEPLFASALALGLPALFSRFFGVEYLNETLSPSLLWGGALIVVANILVIFNQDKSRN